jgi:hypothetical protein
MHTDHTLAIMDDITKQLGAQFRDFTQKTCVAFDTRELHRETEARKRRQQSKSQSQSTTCPDKTGPIRKMFNLNTYKFHALGDYPDTIRRYGTTDSYSTEPVRSFSLIYALTL